MSSAIFGRSSVLPTSLVQSEWWDRLAAFSTRAERNRNPITNQSVERAENVKETFRTASSQTSDAASVSQQIDGEENANKKDNKETNNSQ